MDFEKRNNIYKVVMLVIFTVFITFLATFYGLTNYYTKTAAGKADLLSKNVNISDTSKDVQSKIEMVKSYIDQYYKGTIDESTMEQDAIKGYVAGLGDPYTVYMTDQEYNDLMTSVNGNYVGIGVYMSVDRDGNIVVIKPIDGSPAAAAGIQSGDIIEKVNGEACQGKDADVVSNEIKGKEGTTVDIELLRGDKTINLTITRKTVIIQDVASKVLDNNIGYIQIISFDEASSANFASAYNDLKSKGIKKLIIDIRDNGGGIVTDSTDIAQMFVPKGNTIMVTEDKNGKQQVTKSMGAGSNDMKTVLLVNGNSASASEILTGALKDNKAATVVGKTTFGKGVMQEVFQIATGGAMKVTIQEFKTPNGDTINKVGIKPDIEVDQPADNSSDAQLNKAIELLK
ncbi:MAG: S41 family peptidase [Firmicutes bacterium]|nr:S41 family peptidase [Bacillota bacterium]